LSRSRFTLAGALLVLAAFLVCFAGQQRDPYDIPLAKLALSFDDETHDLKRVRISFSDNQDYSIITPYNDENIEITRMGREKTVYREQWANAWNVTDFEREQLYEVVGSLIKALEICERDLSRKNFGRLLYLDSFLPKFMRGFYFLCEAAQNYNDPLPRVTRVPESAFEVSLNSEKSDIRVNKWRQTPQHIMKLRIICKEFAFQLEQWQKKYLKNKKENRGPFMHSDLRKAYSLFIRIYFNLSPPPRVSTP
jgi:hypothetical protein